MMAIVRNLARNTDFVDRNYCTHSRSNAGEPNGTLTPAFAGEIVLDTTNNAYWKAMDITNNSWVALTPPN